jgi:DNA-binding CsgD family transcriptional regulator
MRHLLHWRWPLGVVAGGLFTLLLVEDWIVGGEPITALGVVTDVLDLALLVGTASVCAVLLLRTREREAEHRLLREDLNLVRLESARWRREMDEHLRGLGAAMQRQFATWGLSRAEQDVALLMLKGFSHKEIARLRGCSEATVRQQAASIYQKADLPGRAGLSAFFLEGLFLPEERAEAPAEIAAVLPAELQAS